MLTYKKLSVDEAQSIYNIYMKVDFPPLELKPFKTIAKLMEAGYYTSYGFYENHQLMGYAFLCDNKEHTYSLLDYYAIRAECRGQGYGQRIVNLLREIYKEYEAVLLEAENPDFAQSEEERKVRTRRVHFYEKCGVVKSGLISNVFDVDYVILVLGCKFTPDRDRIREKLTDIYRVLVREPYFSQKVHI